MNKRVNSTRGFEEWLANAKTGESCIYHVGSLVDDRRFKWFSNSKKSEAYVVSELANATYKAHKADLIYLVQRRLQESDNYEYLAERRRPMPAPRPRGVV
jgi:hypothetical protein